MTDLSSEQLDQIEERVRRAVRDELADAGLRLDGPEHQDEAREDFRFVRRLRIGVNGIAAKLGWAIIAAFLGGIVWLLQLGLDAWRGS